MNRRNFAVSALALTALAFAPSLGCKKDKGGAASGSFAHLPKDTAFAMGISPSKITSSALFKKYESKFADKIPGEVAEFKEKCGMDPMKDFTSIVIAGSNVEKPDGVILVTGNFDKAKAEECVTKMGGTAKDGVWTTDGDTMNTHWVADNTVAISEKKSVEDLKNLTKDGSVKDNAEMMKYLSKVDSSAALWVATGTLPAQAAGMANSMGATPKAGYASVKVSDGVKATVGVAFNSGDDAKKVSDMVSTQLEALKKDPMQGQFVKDVGVKQDGSNIVINAGLSGEQIGMVIPMLGMMGL